MRERPGGSEVPSMSVSLARSTAWLILTANSRASTLDAWLLALLSIVLQLPRSKTSDSLRDKLETSCPSLISWITTKS